MQNQSNGVSEQEESMRSHFVISGCGRLEKVTQRKRKKRCDAKEFRISSSISLDTPINNKYSPSNLNNNFDNNNNNDDNKNNDNLNNNNNDNKNINLDDDKKMKLSFILN